MTGGGFGGSAIALVPADQISRVVGSVADAFSENGFDAPDIFSVTPSDGAGRDHS
jgi:galactokinase